MNPPQHYDSDPPPAPRAWKQQGPVPEDTDPGLDSNEEKGADLRLPSHPPPAPAAQSSRCASRCRPVPGRPLHYPRVAFCSPKKGGLDPG